MKIGKIYQKIAKIDNSSIVYIDEAGVDNRLYREYRRASKEENLCRYSGEKRQKISMIGRWIRKKFIAPLTFSGGYDKEVLIRG